MRRVIMCFGAIIWFTVAAFGQNKQILYGFSDIPQSLMLNPGSKTNLQKHLGIPLLSQIHLNGGSSGVTVFDIFGESDVDISTRLRQKVFSMANTDFFTVTQQLELLNLGWRSESDFYFSGGIYEEVDFIAYFPKFFAILALDGNQPFIGTPFSLDEINSRGDAVMVYHFGVNKQVTKKLTVGVRAKLYSSLGSYSTTDNSGTFITAQVPGSENIYEHRLDDANLVVRTSGIEDGGVGNAFFGGNMGVGVDLGASYDISERVYVTASALDVGAIFHSKKLRSYNIRGDYTLDGLEFLFPNEGDPFPYYDELEQAVEDAVYSETFDEKYTEWRPTKLNASAVYKFGKGINTSGECDCRNTGSSVDREQEVGLQFYGISRPKSWQMAGTLFYSRRITDKFSAKATYTVDSFSDSNIGLGGSATFGKFNMYLAVDNLLKYGNLAKAKSVSLQLGFNIKMDRE